MDVEQRLRIFKLLMEIAILIVGFLALVMNLDAVSAVRRSQEEATINYKEIMTLISEQNQQLDRFAATCAIQQERASE